MLLENYVINKIKLSTDDNIIYSDDYIKRVVINDKEGIISVSYQTLEIYDEINSYFFEDVNSNNFLIWEDCAGISYYESFAKAKAAAIIELKLNN